MARVIKIILIIQATQNSLLNLGEDYYLQYLVQYLWKVNSDTWKDVCFFFFFFTLN